MHVGLFDSGVGGLTVLKELVGEFPNAKFSYLGDTARLPYGNKAPETLRKYSQENMVFLKEKKVEAIVIACHSASSVCLDMEDYQGIPIFNVIAPSCAEALEKSGSKKIGVMATKATIKSSVYPNYIKDLDNKAEVIGQECPLLVPLVEEGLIDDEMTHLALSRYLKSLESTATILLGCTHYPILQDEIQKMAPGKSLINPASSVAEKMRTLWPKSPEGEGQIDIYLTDHAPHFIDHAQRLLGEKITELIHPPSLK
ncbi:MAG: glutamate racemase [Bdellovibrionales bacterium]|nr:glutamate racemase [Bdellovibrionales bacterium]NQZ19090.1 glutamate racemase [Bdellovibrionales bacterium]